MTHRRLSLCAALLLACLGCASQPHEEDRSAQAADAARVVAAFLADFEAEQSTHGHPMTPAEVSALASREHPGQLVVSFGVGSDDRPRTMSLRLPEHDCLAVISPSRAGDAVERALTCGGREFAVAEGFALR